MHRSLPIEAELSSPTTRFSFAGLELPSGNRPRSRRRPRPRWGCFLPGLVRPAAWRGAALSAGSSIRWKQAAPGNGSVMGKSP